MLSDLQIVDGFDALRAEFYRANPRVRPIAAPDSKSRADASIEEILEAWLCAALDITQPNPERKRWLRVTIRAVMEGRAPSIEIPGEPSKRAEKTLNRLAEIAHKLSERSGRNGRIKLPEHGLSPAAELAVWRDSLPGLEGAAGWRFLARMGRPLADPDAATRGFMWRLGLIEKSASTAKDQAGAVSQLERISGVTAVGPEELRRLIEWHTRLTPDLEDSGRCGRKPRCAGCCFEAMCAWRRYRDEGPETDADGGPEMELLRRRIDEQQEETLADPEVLAALLHSGQAGARPMQIAETLLRKFGGLRGVEMATVHELKNIKGIGEGRARQIKAAIELGRRLMSQPLRRGDSFSGSMDVWLAFRNRYRHIPQEHFITLLLDTRNRVIESSLVSKGTLNGSHAHPREVFKQAIRHSASALILMHNHPSGDPQPSAEDIAVTRQLAEAGRILGIRVLDHIILGAETYYSFKDEGKL